MADEATETVLATARLARLELDPARAAELAPQFAAILAAFGRLAELAGDDAPPVDADGLRDVTRADEPRPGLARETFLAAAPERAAEHLRVPRAVGRAT